MRRVQLQPPLRSSLATVVAGVRKLRQTMAIAPGTPGARTTTPYARTEERDPWGPGADACVCTPQD
jgi:hypothetical protein